LASTSLEYGKYSQLSISDNGQGIPPELMNKIFEPYFTTKKQGKGTGLGLAVVYGIVKEHGGEIIVDSEPGKGTTFNIFLPIIEKESIAMVEPAKKAEVLPTGDERILLVDDDEEPIARLEYQMLSRLGYKVTFHVNSQEALEAFKDNPHDFDLIITDMTMPNLTGDQLAEKLIEIRPDIPIIVCTGFSEWVNEEKAKAIGVKGLLMKPVVKSNMANLVRKVLEPSVGTK